MPKRLATTVQNHDQLHYLSRSPSLTSPIGGRRAPLVGAAFPVSSFGSSRFVMAFYCTSAHPLRFKGNHGIDRECTLCLRQLQAAQKEVRQGPAELWLLRSPKVLAFPCPIIRSSLLLSTTLSDVLLSAPTTFESTLYFQILRIIRTTGLDVEDISARYFRGIHSFIPVLSRPRFHGQLAQEDVPPAAFSVLLLCMCLIAYHPDFSRQPQPIDQDTLYLTAKSIVTQVQTSFPPSLPLVQAGVIIAAYEYANGKIHNAISSIGNCARMGYTIGLHLARPVKAADPVPPLQTEESNTWWGIIICER
ncbi:hypothetical protein N7526_005632 [Penicillium atrosanguineum]|nr:hypothetical protein N7526_005632 [Penicillium atrosanguineum]